MILGNYEYRFYCGPNDRKVLVTIHDFRYNSLASVAEISWKGPAWREFFEFLRGKRYGFNPETKTWKVQCCELFYHTCTDGDNEDNLLKDGFKRVA